MTKRQKLIRGVDDKGNPLPDTIRDRRITPVKATKVYPRQSERQAARYSKTK